MTPDPSATAVVLPRAVSVPVDRARPNSFLLSLLTLGHMVIDITTSWLMQPPLVALRNKTARRWLLPRATTRLPLAAFVVAPFLPATRAR